MSGKKDDFNYNEWKNQNNKQPTNTGDLFNDHEAKLFNLVAYHVEDTIDNNKEGKYKKAVRSSERAAKAVGDLFSFRLFRAAHKV